jgi:hypothetical protein
VFRNTQVILQFSGAVSEFIIEDLYGLTTNTICKTIENLTMQKKIKIALLKPMYM